MDWLKNLITNNPFKSLILPTGLSVINFSANLFDALRDGMITTDEWHKLAASSSGIETLALVVLMAAFKKNSSGQ